MTNYMNLKGIACPHCSSDGDFNIQATALFTRVSDEGTETYENVQWDADSYCECCACDHEGTISTFTVLGEKDSESHWTVHPTYPVVDWQAAVASEETQQSYNDWVNDKIDQEDED